MPDGIKPKLSVVILTRGKTALLENCLDSLTGFVESVPTGQAEVIVVEHETDLARGLGSLNRMGGRYYRRIDTEGSPESFSTLNNFGVEHSTGEFVCLLNNDVVLQPGVLPEMLRSMQEKPQVGIVGAKLLFPQGTIQHIGVIFDAFGIPRHLGWGQPDSPGYGPANRSELFDAVTFACVLIRREVWDAVGGLDTAFHFNFEDIDFCLKARKLGWRCFVNHLAKAYHFESQSSKHRQTFEHSVVRNLKIFRDRWIFSGAMEGVLNVPIVREFGPLHDERPNIAFVPAGIDAGISWWRMEQVSRMLSDKKLANVQKVYATQTDQQVMDTIGKANMVVWQGHHHIGVKRLAAMGQDRSFRMVYEYDDHPIHISPFAQAYRVFGCQEKQIRSKDGEETWIWRDGQDGFDVEANRANRQRQLEIISLCDAVTTTTEPLGEYFRTLNPYVFVLPNCLNFGLYQPMTDFYERRPGPIRIGWWGGDNHWHDISVIGTALKDFVNANDVRLVLLGAFYKGPLRGIDLNKVEDRPWVHVEAFPWRLAAAALDIVIVPLANPTMLGMQFNHYKSEIKWLEASALKTPSLVQGGVAAYQNCIHGETGLTFLTDEDFKANLAALCADATLRKRLGHAAYDWAREHRDLEKEVYRWSEAYDKILRKCDLDVSNEPVSAVAAEGT